MSSPTITIKLRDTRTTPAPTRTFTLPAARLLRTSAYFRAHLASPLSRHRDGIIRLNFLDFALFANYAEWLTSGEIFSKAGLAQLYSPTASSNSSSSAKAKARAAYTDYLGAWFLGSWVEDSSFKDALVSVMIERMEDVEGYPREFVRALTPSLVHLVFVGSREGDVIRRFLFAAVERFGMGVDVQRFVPDEGGEEWPRGFVRGLLVYLHRVRDGNKRTVEEVDDKEIARADTVELSSSTSVIVDEGGSSVLNATEELSSITFTTVWKSKLPDTSDITSNAATTTGTGSQLTSTSILDPGSDLTQTATATTTSQHIPPPFMKPMENLWTPTSHISWPSTASTSKRSSSGYISQNTGSATTSTFTTSSWKSKTKHGDFSWPRTVEEQCVFHEHSLSGEPCHRDVRVQT
jgi:hypothetical protein